MIIFSEITRPQEFLQQLPPPQLMWSLWRHVSQLETRKEVDESKSCGLYFVCDGEGRGGGVVRFAATPAAADEHTPHLSVSLPVARRFIIFFRSRQTVPSSRPLSSTLSPVDQTGRHAHTHRLTRADPGKSPHSVAGAEKRGDRGCLLTSTAMLRPSGSGGGSSTCLSERNPRCSGGC